MSKIWCVIFFLILFIMTANGFVWAEHDCSRTVVCSDGSTLVTTRCTSSHTEIIIDGHDVDSDHPGPGQDHHHDQGNDNEEDSHDPCGPDHGHEIDNDADGSSQGDHQDEDSDDPYHLRHGRQHAYDPDDPYGLRHHQTVLTNQSQ